MMNITHVHVTRLPSALVVTIVIVVAIAVVIELLLAWPYPSVGFCRLSVGVIGSILHTSLKQRNIVMCSII